MQFDSETYAATEGNGPDWSENFYRFCTFQAISTDGAMVHAFFFGCEFSECDWYWGHFSQAVFVDVKFVDCVFRGCSFPGCRFIECTFVNCEFTVDSFGRGCSFEGTSWYATSAQNSKGIEEFLKNAP